MNLIEIDPTVIAPRDTHLKNINEALHNIEDAINVHNELLRELMKMMEGGGVDDN